MKGSLSQFKTKNTIYYVNTMLYTINIQPKNSLELKLLSFLMHFFLRRTSLRHHRNNSHLGKAPKILKQKIYIILADMFSLLQKLYAADEMLSAKDCLKYLGTSWVGASFIERTVDISHCCLCSEFCRATTLWVWGAPLLCAVQPSGLLSVD